MSDQREPFVMPNEPSSDAEIDEVGGLPQPEPERWTSNPIRPDECPHCQEYDWPEVWQLRADYDRVVSSNKRHIACLEDAEREVERLREALREALNELGVPSAEYPTPVANAVEILRAALAEPEERE